jgi:ppGpp synthetase/RelA/SpoT-type nucleotidyltranferase
MNSISKSAQDRLGEAIRQGAIPENDEARLDLLRENWERSARYVADVLRLELRIENPDITSRQKSLGTIREKLRRETSIRLSQVRDVAGCRIVLSPGLINQRQTVTQIENRFGTSVRRSIDYLSESQFGYRAIHLELEYEDVLVEIQVRTPLQHAWAESMERLGDIAGRDVRYHHNYQFEHLLPPAQVIAISLAKALADLSAVIKSYEKIEERFQSLDYFLEVHPNHLGIRQRYERARISLSLANKKRHLLKVAQTLKPQFDKLKDALL